MLQSEIPENLLSLVYATATDRSKWQEFCDALSSFNSAPIMMFGHNIGTDESLGIIGGGLDPAQLVRYHQHFAVQNPWMHMNVAMPVGTVGVSDQALPRHDLFKTEFYNDWLQPQEDIVAGPAVICHRSTDRIVAMAGPCRARKVDKTLPHTVALFQSLVPHLARSIKIASALSNSSSTSFSHLDASSSAIIIVQQNGQIGFINKSAEYFISNTQSIYANHVDKLTSGNEQLLAFLNIATVAMQNNDFDSLPEPVSLKDHKTGSCVIHAHIFPSEIDQKFPCTAWSNPVAGAFVITGRFGIGRADDYSKIARSLGATPAEALLAQGLLDGQSLYDYAELNSVSRHTVRNQMRALLHKTETANQMEFVRMMCRLSSPFSV
jgi:DNA-binding CsgD family transcriptional regulator